MPMVLDEYIGKIGTAEDLLVLIEEAQSNETSCDREQKDISTIPDQSRDLPLLEDAQDLIYILTKLLCLSPNLHDDKTRQAVAAYFKRTKTEAKKLVTLENLTILSQAKSSLSWLKYELLLVHLIKEKVYKSKVLANEVLSVVKHDLPSDIAKRFSSVMSACVKHCQRANDGDEDNGDEEEKEKWCEIIDWVSWFIGSEQEEFY